jgi:hypothetical protein
MGAGHIESFFHEGGQALELDAQTTTPDQLQLNRRGYKVKSPWVRNLLTFLMVFGPGLIVMEADNDAGAVSTYTQAGAQYGLHLLWVLLLLLSILGGTRRGSAAHTVPPGRVAFLTHSRQ